MSACGGVISSASDAGTDVVMVVTKCNSIADCPQGYECAYPMGGGCTATRQCFPPALECQKLVSSCSCADGLTTVSGDCNDAFQQPVTGSLCECTSALACELCQVSGFLPPPQGAAAIATKACSSADISSFVTACLSASATQATCTAWQQSADAGTCGACVITQTSSATWGPLVCDVNQCILNDGGCVDILAGQVALEHANGGTGSCGELVAARDACVDYACGECTASSDVTTCQTDAVGFECKTYSDAVSTSPLCTGLDAGTSVCAPQSDTDYAAFINVFCGSGK